MATEAPVDAEVSIDELQHQLAHIETLQLQLETLRSILPRLVQPIASGHKSRAQVVSEVRTAAISSKHDLSQFRETWSSDETRQILAKASQSASVDSDMTKAQDIAAWGWKAT